MDSIFDNGDNDEWDLELIDELVRRAEEENAAKVVGRSSLPQPERVTATPATQSGGGSRWQDRQQPKADEHKPLVPSVYPSSLPKAGGYSNPFEQRQRPPLPQLQCNPTYGAPSRNLPCQQPMDLLGLMDRKVALDSGGLRDQILQHQRQEQDQDQKINPGLAADERWQFNRGLTSQQPLQHQQQQRLGLAAPPDSCVTTSESGFGSRGNSDSGQVWRQEKRPGHHQLQRPGEGLVFPVQERKPLQYGEQLARPRSYEHDLQQSQGPRAGFRMDQARHRQYRDGQPLGLQNPIGAPDRLQSQASDETQPFYNEARHNPQLSEPVQSEKAAFEREIPKVMGGTLAPFSQQEKWHDVHAAQSQRPITALHEMSGRACTRGSGLAAHPDSLIMTRPAAGGAPLWQPLSQRPLDAMNADRTVGKSLLPGPLQKTFLDDPSSDALRGGGGGWREGEMIGKGTVGHWAGREDHGGVPSARVNSSHFTNSVQRPSRPQITDRALVVAATDQHKVYTQQEHDADPAVPPGGVEAGMHELIQLRNERERLLESVMEKEGNILILRSRLAQADREMSDLKRKVSSAGAASVSSSSRQPRYEKHSSDVAWEIERLRSQLLFKDQEILELQSAREERDLKLRMALEESARLRVEAEAHKKALAEGCNFSQSQVPRDQMQTDRGFEGSQHSVPNNAIVKYRLREMTAALGWNEEEASRERGVGEVPREEPVVSQRLEMDGADGGDAMEVQEEGLKDPGSSQVASDGPGTQVSLSCKGVGRDNLERWGPRKGDEEQLREQTEDRHVAAVMGTAVFRAGSVELDSQGVEARGRTGGAYDRSELGQATLDPLAEPGNAEQDDRMLKSGKDKAADAAAQVARSGSPSGALELAQVDAVWGPQAVGSRGRYGRVLVEGERGSKLSRQQVPFNVTRMFGPVVGEKCSLVVQKLFASCAQELYSLLNCNNYVVRESDASATNDDMARRVGGGGSVASRAVGAGGMGRGGPRRKVGFSHCEAGVEEDEEEMGVVTRTAAEILHDCLAKVMNQLAPVSVLIFPLLSFLDSHNHNDDVLQNVLHVLGMILLNNRNCRYLMFESTQVLSATKENLIAATGQQSSEQEQLVGSSPLLDVRDIAFRICASMKVSAACNGPIGAEGPTGGRSRLVFVEGHGWTVGKHGGLRGGGGGGWGGGGAVEKKPVFESPRILVSDAKQQLSLSGAGCSAVKGSAEPPAAIAITYAGEGKDACYGDAGYGSRERHAEHGTGAVPDVVMAEEDDVEGGRTAENRTPRDTVEGLRIKTEPLDANAPGVSAENVSKNGCGLDLNKDLQLEGSAEVMGKVDSRAQSLMAANSPFLRVVELSIRPRRCEGVQREALCVLLMLVANLDPKGDRQKFAPILFEGVISAVLTKNTGTQVRLEAVCLVHLLLQCPGIRERVCLRIKEEHADRQNSELAKAGLVESASSVPRKDDEVLELLAACLNHGGYGCHDYALRRSALRTFNYLAFAQGGDGLAKILALGSCAADASKVKQEPMEIENKALGKHAMVVHGVDTNKALLGGRDLRDNLHAEPRMRRGGSAAKRKARVLQRLEDGEHGLEDCLVVNGEIIKERSIPVRLVAVLERELSADDADADGGGPLSHREVVAEERRSLIWEAMSLLCQMLSHQSRGSQALSLLMQSKQTAHMSLRVASRIVNWSQNNSSSRSVPQRLKVITGMSENITDLANRFQNWILASFPKFEESCKVPMECPMVRK
ncbi:hypothetical protein CBR_g24386 [Chara braunii]|uniref:Uncharacterized protein n=1 Tax=Chara braunii TaxID=69332 RepID=A0A388JMI2_CHABU|nr:hypothetical protein CBR_g24386 [Chara braunii]|eukprot:GBG59040.1 hypothetical protein CBR_g24386 [Chara braunii]